MGTPFNIHSNCYNGRLLVSLCIEVDGNQLTIQDYDYTKAAVLRFGDITITSKALQDCLSAECPFFHVHNVARVKRGQTRPLFEIDITSLTNLEHFCESLEGRSIDYHGTVLEYSTYSLELDWTIGLMNNVIFKHNYAL